MLYKYKFNEVNEFRLKFFNIFIIREKKLQTISSFMAFENLE